MKLFKNKAVPGNYPKGMGIEWVDKRSFRLGGYEFHTMETSNDFLSPIQEKADSFLMAKNTHLIQQYLAIIKESKPENIVELGVHRGGSAAFLYQLARPRKLLALELSPDRLTKLDDFIVAENAADAFRVEFGVDQADVARVSQLKNEHIGVGRNLDLVFDDASHVLGPTRASFEALFPYLREGGVYFIEDYATSHVAAASFVPKAMAGSKSAANKFKSIMSSSIHEDRQPCHVLAVEAMLACMVDQGIIQRVTVNKQALRIIRGHKDIENAEDFDLRALAADHWGLLDSQPDSDTAALLSS
jgi:predicted O-methyltransferase YrrM